MGKRPLEWDLYDNDVVAYNDVIACVSFFIPFALLFETLVINTASMILKRVLFQKLKRTRATSEKKGVLYAKYVHLISCMNIKRNH